MKIKVVIVCLLSCFILNNILAQKIERNYIRIGNSYFKKGTHNLAEEYYQKACIKNKSIESCYNLANVQLLTGHDSVALTNFKNAIMLSSENKLKIAKVYHNTGNLFYAQGVSAQNLNQQDKAYTFFSEAVEQYKSALRIAPNDNKTRYNLVKAQYMMKKTKQHNDQKNNNSNKQQDKKNQTPDSENQEKDSSPKEKPSNTSKNSIDDDTANQLLNSSQQDENNVQKKIKRTSDVHRNLEKDW